MAEEKKPLKERVEAFNMMELPGQPRMMHMGTSYLVNDLWREVERLREEIKGHEAFQAGVNEALSIACKLSGL